MELRTLRYFLAVAASGTILQAAESVLHVTQPTLSRQLKDLEDELGTTLFVRGRTVSLTADGERFRRRAEEIVALAEKTRREFGRGAGEISGEIAIGAGETEAMREVARSMRRISEAHPDVTWRVFSGNADDVSEKLDAGTIDFGVFIESAIKSRYSYVNLPLSDRWGVLAREGSDTARRKFITPEHLASLPLIVSAQALGHGELSGWLKNQAVSPKIVATYNLAYNAAFMAEEGLGFALVLDGVVNTAGKPLRFVPLRPQLKAGVSVVWKKGAPLSPAAEVFAAEMRRMADVGASAR